MSSAWREHAAYRRGLALYRAGHAWEAHEAWEDAWRVTPPGRERELLQGLIQLAAAVVQARRGRARGARSVLARARGHLARAAPVTCGLDVAALLDRLRGWEPAADPPDLGQLRDG